MDTIAVLNTTDKTRDVVYNIWSKSLNKENIEIYELSTSIAGHIPVASSTLAAYDINKLNKTAIEWDNIEIIRNEEVHVFSLTSTKPKDIFLFPETIDHNAIEFCAKKNILSYAQDYYISILQTFRQVKSIGVELSKDYEIEDITKVRFNIVMSNNVDAILDDEDNFLENVRKTILPDVLSNFVLTLQIF
jgi:hypothetical protein